MIPLEAIISLGVGGTLGIVIYFMYRHDRRASKEQIDIMVEQLRVDRKFMEDRMDGIIGRDQDTREANTKALTELTTLLQRMNGRIK